MGKFIKIRFQKKQLAYTLSAAILISFVPHVSFASEQNIETPTVTNQYQSSITASAATGSTVIPGSSGTDASTGGSINTSQPAATQIPPAQGSQPDTVTGGTIAPGSTAVPVIPPYGGGSQIWTPESTTAPDNSQVTVPSATPPVTNTPQPGTVTGGAVLPGTTPGASTGSAVTPDASQTPSPSPLAVGTKFTAGNYIYRVTGNNTVALKGFAKGVSLATVTAQNQVTYNKVKYNVTKIGDNAFKGQTCIKTVLVRKNITDISLNAFYNCKNITKVTIRTGLKIIRKQAFMGCKKLKTINITSTVLSQVKKNAFKNIKNGAVINVVNKQAKLAVKASIPASVKVNQM